MHERYRFPTLPLLLMASVRSVFKFFVDFRKVPRQVAAKKSGDESPHSKKKPQMPYGSWG